MALSWTVGALKPQSGSVRFLDAVIRCLDAVTHDKQTNKQTMSELQSDF